MPLAEEFLGQMRADKTSASSNQAVCGRIHDSVLSEKTGTQGEKLAGRVKICPGPHGLRAQMLGTTQERKP